MHFVLDLEIQPASRCISCVMPQYASKSGQNRTDAQFQVSVLHTQKHTSHTMQTEYCKYEKCHPVIYSNTAAQCRVISHAVICPLVCSALARRNASTG